MPSFTFTSGDLYQYLGSKNHPTHFCCWWCISFILMMAYTQIWFSICLIHCEYCEICLIKTTRIRDLKYETLKDVALENPNHMCESVCLKCQSKMVFVCQEICQIWDERERRYQMNFMFVKSCTCTNYESSTSSYLKNRVSGLTFASCLFWLNQHLSAIPWPIIVTLIKSFQFRLHSWSISNNHFKWYLLNDMDWPGIWSILPKTIRHF